MLMLIGFEPISLPKAGLLRRLAGRPDPANAFFEIRNLLGSRPVDQIDRSEIILILGQYRHDTISARPQLLEIYRHAVTGLANDGTLSDVETQALAALRSLFQLSQHEARPAELAALHDVFRRVVSAALADGHITDAERSQIDANAAALGLTDEEALAVYKAEVFSVLQWTVQQSLSDGMWSDDEERQLQRMAENLRATVAYDKNSTRLIAEAKYRWQVIHGDLPICDVPVKLQRGESCHIHGQFSYHEFRKVTHGVRFHGLTASVKVIGPIRYRIGGYNGYRVSRDVLTLIDDGRLYVTNKRLFFDGAKRNISLPLHTVTNFTIFRDGIQIERGKGKDQYFLGESVPTDVLGAILDRAIEAAR